MPTARRKPTDAEKERLTKGIKARQETIKTLISRHQSEFDELHAQNRLAVGLSARSAGPSRAQLEERVRKQRERLEKWERELRLAG